MTTKKNCNLNIYVNFDYFSSFFFSANYCSQSTSNLKMYLKTNWKNNKTFGVRLGSYLMLTSNGKRWSCFLSMSGSHTSVRACNSSALCMCVFVATFAWNVVPNTAIDVYVQCWQALRHCVLIRLFCFGKMKRRKR